MPTLEHNGLVAMFRDNPPLAPHLIETLFHLPVPPYATVKVVEASLDQLIPIEFRADLVLELLNDNNALVLPGPCTWRSPEPRRNGRRSCSSWRPMPMWRRGPRRRSTWVWVAESSRP